MDRHFGFDLKAGRQGGKGFHISVRQDAVTGENILEFAREEKLERLVE